MDAEPINHSNLLIRNKLRVPRLRNVVQRDRLIQKLNLGVEKKLTLLIAPAGFGKTTILTEWVRYTNLPVAWVSLDEDDNNPISFWTYLLTSIHSVKPPLGETALPLLKEPKIGCIESIPILLLNEMDKQNDPLVVVLDDYHLIRNQSIHASLSIFLEHLPKQVHLILSTRANPPLQLAYLRVSGELTDISAKDLRFNLPETICFFKEIINLEISDDDLRELIHITEGWAVGLQIVALSIRGEEDKTKFIRYFRDCNRYIGDYLSEEVINDQSDEIQFFLLQTSILDQFNASLCNLVTQRIDSQDIIDTLEQQNLFITPLGEGSFYRYHQLFADALRHRLDRYYPELVPVLRSRAAVWYDENGYLTNAIKIYLSLNEYDHAARLINIISEEILYSGELDLYLEWMRKLPDEIIAQWATILICQAWALVATDLQFDVADEQLRRAERFLEGDIREIDEADRTSLSRTSTPEENYIQGSISVMRSYSARLKGDLLSAIPYAQKALEILPNGELIMRTWASWNLAEAYRFIGDVNQWGQSLTDAITTCRLSRNPGVMLLTIDNLAELQVSRGELHLAHKTWQNLLRETAEDLGSKEILIASTIHAGLGGLYYEWNDFEQATQHLLKAIQLAKLGRMIEVTLESHITLAKLEYGRGNKDCAIQIIQDLEPLLNTKINNRHTIRARAYRAYWEFNLGNLGFFNQWLKARRLHDNQVIYFYQEPEYFILAKVMIQGGHYQDALSLLVRLNEAARNDGRVGSVIKALVLQAVASERQGNTAGSFVFLDSALKMAEHGGYIRSFVDADNNIAQLLYRYNTRGPPWDYVVKILSACSNTSQPFCHNQLFTEKLSDRELEVLRLIAARLSCREIAELLQISVNTARTHVRNIYSKLDVHKQSQAVNRARELGLIN